MKIVTNEERSQKSIQIEVIDRLNKHRRAMRSLEMLVTNCYKGAGIDSTDFWELLGILSEYHETSMEALNSDSAPLAGA